VPLSVLHVSQPTAAGVAECVRALASDQVARGWRVSVACAPKSHLARRVLEAGAEHQAWRARRAPGPTLPAETQRLTHLIAQAKPDVVHLHSAKAGLAGRLALRGRLPTVFQPHAWSFYAVEGPVRAAALAWERFAAARWTSVVVCASEGERLQGEAAGVKAHWRVIPNGIDLSRIPPPQNGERDAARRRLGLGDAPLVVCVGRLARQKGQDTLLDAWPSVAARVPRCELILVGDGPDRERLELRKVPGTRFVGWQSDVGVWLLAADVVAVPSRWEVGVTLATMEALARARSVVATDVPGVREGLGSGVGQIVPVEDPDELAGALADRLLDPARREREGDAGRRLVEAQFDVRRTTEAVADLYQKLAPVGVAHQ
jgi:glycosyltransferase involved in cell wall biosynthesis